MEIVLVARDDDLWDAWTQTCGELENVHVYRGSILEVDCDAVVSPANSFGFMDGGIDMRYSMHFGWEVQDRLQSLIREKHHGELLVGLAEIVDTGNLRVPFLIAAPTMRVPMLLYDSINPYLAARAALLLVQFGTFDRGIFAGQRIAEVVNTIAFPGLGTGIGGVSPTICARQVRAAIEDVSRGIAAFPTTWAEASKRHQRLYSDHVQDLQRRPNYE